MCLYDALNILIVIDVLEEKTVDNKILAHRRGGSPVNDNQKENGIPKNKYQ